MYWQDNQKMTPMRFLINEYPKLAHIALTKCMYECPEHSNQDSFDYTVMYNFDLLDDGFVDLNQPRYISATCCTGETRLVGVGMEMDRDKVLMAQNDEQHGEKSLEDLGKDPEPKGHETPYPFGWHDPQNDPLLMMVVLNRDELIQHRLIKTFINLREYVTSTLDCLKMGHGLIVAVLFSITIANQVEKMRNSERNVDICIDNSTCRITRGHAGDDWDHLYPILLICCFIGLLQDLLEVMFKGISCVTGRNIVDLISYIFIFVATLRYKRCKESGFDGDLFVKTIPHCNSTNLFSDVNMTNMPKLDDNFVILQDWQLTVGTLAIYTTWMSLIFKATDIRHIGMFVTMIHEVLFTFFKITLLLVPFILAFSLAFYTLLRDVQDLSPFRGEAEYMMKTFVMTMGELDYSKIITAILNKKVGYPDRILAILFFIMFLIVMPLVFMNLLLGLAVGDIENIRNKADIKDLRGNALSGMWFLYRLPAWLQQYARNYLKDLKLPGDSRIKVSVNG